MDKLTVQQLDLAGKRVLLRVDFNVPLHPDGSIADDTRLKEAVPTIEYILSKGGSIILMSHLGRPGKKDPLFSLAPVAKSLAALLGRPVLFTPECIGPSVEAMAKALKPQEILLLENLRFYPAEEHPKDDPTFAQKLALLGDYYVNDAFGTAHRAHSSTYTIASYFPGKAAAGLLMQKELSFLGELLSEPKRPFYALLGGSKISTKMGVLTALCGKVDALFIGGGMIFTLLKAQGLSIGDSIHEDLFLPKVKEFLETCAKKSLPVHLPEDLVIADKFQNGAQSKIIDTSQGIPEGWLGMDIGPKTLRTWTSLLSNAQTIFWNGPLGVFEFPDFAKGTETIAKTLSSLKTGATTIVGGGDSVAAIQKFHLSKNFSHLSTGGGASLEWIEYGHLPGIDALSDCQISGNRR